MTLMNRRELTQTAVAGLLLLASGARAQGAAPVEGKDFVRLNTPVAVPAGGKIDVIEFFWYGCPHCNALESSLEAWVKKLPADVAFRRVPAAFNPMWELHAKAFYALEAMGKLEEMHRRMFAALHVQRLRLDKEADLVAYMGSNGVDAAKFKEAFDSFGVATKLRQGKQLAESYKIDGVPALGIHGRWFTAPSLAGGNERTFAVADALIVRARKPA